MFLSPVAVRRPRSDAPHYLPNAGIFINLPSREVFFHAMIRSPGETHCNITA